MVHAVLGFPEQPYTIRDNPRQLLQLSDSVGDQSVQDSPLHRKIPYSCINLRYSTPTWDLLRCELLPDPSKPRINLIGGHGAPHPSGNRLLLRLLKEPAQPRWDTLVCSVHRSTPLRQHLPWRNFEPRRHRGYGPENQTRVLRHRCWILSGDWTLYSTELLGKVLSDWVDCGEARQTALERPWIRLEFRLDLYRSLRFCAGQTAWVLRVIQKVKRLPWAWVRDTQEGASIRNLSRSQPDI